MTLSLHCVQDKGNLLVSMNSNRIYVYDLSRALALNLVIKCEIFLVQWIVAPHERNAFQIFFFTKAKASRSNQGMRTNG